MPLNFQTRVGSVGFCEDSYSDGDTVFDLISKAESGPRSLDVTGLPAEDDVRLQALINAVGDRLHHFCYVHRAPLLMGVLRTPPPSRPRIAAMDLSRCTSLRTFYTSINFYKLEEDLHAAICPTLRSLQAGAPGALAQIVITAWVRLNLATLCNDNAGRRSFSELESAALALRDGRGLSELVFRLLYKRRCVGSESLLSECTSALHDALPRLARAGILRVVSKDVGSLERESIYGSAKRRTQIADMVMSLVSEQVPPHLPPADAQSRYDQNRGS
ncbi:hypothetical protein PsYK624_149180 [Phanerochaete sordida]|uniref:Uncharacterized protein n=1 Tax=Phanerochaete sordida TaxID=48140 RepID=A0A9P3LKK4_9APHY|nr:hypothetical protein PsYK624_149180 [Phanerochaete sordida]